MEMKKLLQVTELVCKQANDILLHVTLRMQDAESNPQFQSCREWVLEQHKKAEALVCDMCTTHA